MQKDAAVARGPQWSRMAPEGRAAMFNLKKMTTRMCEMQVVLLQVVLLHTLFMAQMWEQLTVCCRSYRGCFIQVRHLLGSASRILQRGYCTSTSIWTNSNYFAFARHSQTEKPQVLEPWLPSFPSCPKSLPIFQPYNHLWCFCCFLQQANSPSAKLQGGCHRKHPSKTWQLWGHSFHLVWLSPLR